jgi:hypothetical protein
MFFRPNTEIGGMNYQQRNRALFECIRERCERTGGNRNVAYVHLADFTPYPLFLCLIAVLSLGSLMHEFARCSR